MLNKDGQRELAYVVKIDDITPIEGYDWVELAHVSGWTVVVGKGEFKPGDPAIYFEIDSKLPEVKPFTDMGFLVKKHYKIKTQKMCRSISQGLLMSAKNFGWEYFTNVEHRYVDPPYRSDAVGVVDDEGTIHFENGESRFLTQKLGVTYAEPDDNQRKSTSVNKYKRMAQRHGKLFSHQPYRWLMRRDWGKKLLFLFYGRKKDGKNGWPAWVKKTDEERIQNMPWILDSEELWVATEKIDGTSTTFTMKRKPFGRYEFLVCSRNVVFDKPDKKCFYETNVYTEMAEKYDVENVLKDLLKNTFKDANWITLQGETFGSGVQKRTYGLSDHDFRGFNLIVDKIGRFDSVSACCLIQEERGIPWVPIIDPEVSLPKTVDEVLEYATGKSEIDGDMREGIVFRSQDGSKSFKAVSNEYLLKYHS